MNTEDTTLQQREIQRQYANFLDDENESGTYFKRVQTMVAAGTHRLVINLNHLRAANPVRARQLLRAAPEELLSFSAALKEYVSTLNYAYASRFDEFCIGFEGRYVKLLKSLKKLFLSLGQFFNIIVLK